MGWSIDLFANRFNRLDQLNQFDEYHNEEEINPIPTSIGAIFNLGPDVEV